MTAQRGTPATARDGATSTNGGPQPARRGVDIAPLGELLAAVGDDADAARIVLRTRHFWDGDFAVDGHAEEIEQGGAVEERSHVVRSDWPEVLGGRDSGPAPGETLLAALGACVTMTYLVGAAAQGVAIDDLEVKIEASVDLRGGLADIPAGLEDVRVTVCVSSDADDAVLDELGRLAAAQSPVFGTIARPVPISIGVEPVRGEVAA